MQKKIILFSVLSCILFGGVVAASSINGDYKGNPIVKVRVNGNTINPEIPAQIVDGSTLLPLRAVSEILGADVKWNQDTYSVDVNKTDDAEKIKLYSRISFTYVNIILLSDLFTDTNSKLLTLYSIIHNNTNPANYGQLTVDTLNKAIDAYNSTLAPTQKVISESSSYGLSVSDANTLLSKLLSASNDFKESVTILSNYQVNQTTDLNPFFDKLSHAIGLVVEVKNSALEKYSYYYSIGQGTADGSNLQQYPNNANNTQSINQPPTTEGNNNEPMTPSTTAIETTIDGTFEGWTGETIFKLSNGQIWQQTEYNYTYHYAFMPKVIIYNAGSGFKMKVDGIEKAIGVQRIK